MVSLSRVSYRIRHIINVLLVQVSIYVARGQQNARRRRTRNYIRDKSTGYFFREYKNLRNHPDEFKDLTRMTPAMFDLILSKIGERLVKQCIRVPICPSERLLVTLM